jgi:hypothetical protein
MATELAGMLATTVAEVVLAVVVCADEDSHPVVGVAGNYGLDKLHAARLLRELADAMELRAAQGGGS